MTLEPQQPEPAPPSPPSNVSSAPSSSSSSDETLLSSFEAFWHRKKQQFSSSSGSDKEPNSSISSNSASTLSEKSHSSRSPELKCHICNAVMGIIRRRHHCRNCNLPVCGVHSRNQVPLPQLGMMKEVRVCDLCTRYLVERRAGYISPRARQTSRTGLPQSISSSGIVNLDDSSTSDVLSQVAEDKLKPMCGIIYSCQLEEQDSTVDELLYLGTFTMGGRALASRTMKANMAIWKERTFLLTSAEMLCFKAQEEPALGDLRSCVHLTDILHVEIHEEFPRILSVIRSDGRIFRIRAKTAEQCQEIHDILLETMQIFHEAMHRLQRGPQPEDNSIACVTIQHENSFPEQVVVPKPKFGQLFDIEMYSSSILRVYVNNPNVNGVAQFSREMLLSHLNKEVDAEAESYRDDSRGEVLHVHLKAVDKHKQKKVLAEVDYLLVARIGVFAVISGVLHRLEYYNMELVVWLVGFALLLLEFHQPLRLFLVTKRFQSATPLRACCESIQLGKSDEASDELISDEELDSRFLEGCNGNVEEAKHRYMRTIEWRKQNEIDTILTRPSPHFFDMRDCFESYMHKRDKEGNLVTVEVMGNIKRNIEKFLSLGASEDEAIMHVMFTQEYVWTVIDPRPFPKGVQLKIIDLKGISMSDIGGESFAYMKRLGQTIAEYNPERLTKVFIINPPSWFQLLWKLVSPLVKPKTRERTQVIRGQKEIAKTLLEYVDAENLPVEYGGTCECEGGCIRGSPEERDMEEYVTKLNRGDQDCSSHLEQLRQKYRDQITRLESTSALASSFSPSNQSQVQEPVRLTVSI